MSKELGRFDPNIQMFVEPSKESDMNHLRFMRFKAERGDFGYKPMSVPMGENLYRLGFDEITKYALQQSEVTPQEALLRRIRTTGDY